MVLSLHQQLIKAKLFVKIFSENSNFDDDHRSVHPFHGMVKLRLDTNSVTPKIRKNIVARSQEGIK